VALLHLNTRTRSSNAPHLPTTRTRRATLPTCRRNTIGCSPPTGDVPLRARGFGLAYGVRCYNCAIIFARIFLPRHFLCLEDAMDKFMQLCLAHTPLSLV